MQQETIDSFKVVDQNNRGYIIQIDYDRVPFNAQAQFVVSGVTEPPVTRGGHAHKECDQFLICLSGEIEVQSFVWEDTCEDTPDTVNLLSDKRVLHAGDYFHLPPQHLCYQKYKTQDSTLLVLASHSYDPDDAINSINDLYFYMKEKNENSI